MPGDRSRIFIVVLSLSIPIILLGGCHRTRSSDKEDVRHILALRERAMETKDITLYMSCISEDYHDNANTYDVIRDKMEKNFDLFDKIDFSQSNQTIYQDNSAAVVVQDFELSFTVWGAPDHAIGKERIHLEKKAGKWKIVKGL